MENKFANAIRTQSTGKFTENGAKAYNKLSNPVLTLFAQAGSLRTRNESKIREMFRQAYSYDKELTTKMLFYIGDIRGGLGERRTFRICLNELSFIAPQTVENNIHNIAFYNRFDSLYSLINTPVETAMWIFMLNQWLSDVDNYMNNKPCSLLPKWLKSINASSAETRMLARKTMKMLNFPNEKVYRKCLSEMRTYLNIVEKKMCQGNWSDIKYETVPSYAMKKYRKSFGRHDYERFNQYIQDVTSGKKEIKASTLFPYDLVEEYWRKGNCHSHVGDAIDPVIEAQWKALPDYLNGSEVNALCMVDVSGSMHGRPICSAIGLGTYFAQRNRGAFHNMYLTFTSTPAFETIEDGQSLYSIINQVTERGIGYSTNLEKAFELVLRTAVQHSIPKTDMPQAIIILSDSEIDAYKRQDRVDFMTAMEQKFNRYGYDLPKLIFFQVESRQDTFLTLRPDALFISGQSAAAFKQVIGNIEGTAWDLVLRTLNDARYENVVI